MERLTFEKNPNIWDRGRHPTKYTSRYTFQEVVARLAAYEDTGLEPEKIKEHEAAYIEIMTRTYGPFREKIGQWLQAEKDGRLVVLPCKNDTVYTIEEDYFNCDKCKNGSSARYQPQIGRVSCDMENGEHCPFYVKEHKVDGFEIGFDEVGHIGLSLPGEFGCEGLEQFRGIDDKVYYTREEAEAALKKVEADDEI